MVRGSAGKMVQVEVKRRNWIAGGGRYNSVMTFWGFVSWGVFFLYFFWLLLRGGKEGRTVDTVAEDNDSDGRLDDTAGDVNDVWYCHSWDVRDLVLV